jgi:predicted tellurium resistance membrane protein TerC
MELVATFFIVFLGLTLMFHQAGGFTNQISSTLYYMILVSMGITLAIVRRLRRDRRTKGSSTTDNSIYGSPMSSRKGFFK